MIRHINITDIPEDINILEQTHAFLCLLTHYKKKTGITLTHEDFWNDLRKLQDFHEFIMMEGLCGSLPIRITSSEARARAQGLLTDFRQRYGYEVRNADMYYIKIRHQLFGEIKDQENEMQVKKEMRKFLAAYHMMKRVFENQSREGLKPGESMPERYFNHLTGTMDIVLNELPNPNLDRAIIALLHDSLEDIKGMTYETLNMIFGPKIAAGVKELSKKDLTYYMSQHEIEIFNGIKDKHDPKRLAIEEKAKLARQEDYFGHLHALDDDVLSVKFADRIHNLRTLDGMKRSKVIKKIKETLKYFNPVAERRNMTAFNLMNIEITKLIRQFHIKDSELIF